MFAYLLNLIERKFKKDFVRFFSTSTVYTVEKSCFLGYLAALPCVI